MSSRNRAVQNTIFLLLPFFLCRPVGAQADRELQYVLDRYLEVMGGAASLENVISAYMTGTVTLPDNRTIPISILKKRPEKLRIVEKYENLRVVHGYNGKVAWRSLVSDYQTRSEILTRDQARSVILSAPLANALMQPRNQRSPVKIELAGEAMMARVPCYRVWVNFPDGSRREYLIEKETFLDRKISDFDAEGNLEMECLPSNFKDYSGVLFSMKQIKKVDGKVTSILELDGVEINLGIFDRLFDPPAELVEKDDSSSEEEA